MPLIFFSRILRSEALVYKSYLFRRAILRKLFDIRLSYKHCNFSPICLLVKMALKSVTRSIQSTFEISLVIFHRSRCSHVLGNKKVHAYYVPSRKKQAQFYERLAWDKASRWGKRQQMGSNRKNSRERSELSGCLGRGKGWRSLETCIWCSRSMIPDSGIMLWLVQCLHVDRFVVLLTVSCTFNITPLQFRKRFFKTRISSKQYKFLCEAFHLSLGSKKSKKYTCDLLQKEQEAFKIWSFSYIILW